MFIIILVLIVLAAVLLPGMWAQHILSKYQVEDNTLQGNGGELAKHLIERFQLDGVSVEETNLGDHYDPETKCVRLTAANMGGQSLTAVATAAHEVGHAIQHYTGYTPLLLRTRFVKGAMTMEKVGSTAMIISPVAMLLTKSPLITGLLFGSAILSMLTMSLVHVVTLPVEFNASFNRALPILREGYLNPEQIKIAEKILLACALTYLAQSLMSLLNLGRWLAVLRR
jgi:Zn-dependent membrane protease YugP